MIDPRTFNKLASLAVMGVLTGKVQLNAEQAASVAGEVLLAGS